MLAGYFGGVEGVIPFIACFARTSELLAASNAERSSSELSESSSSSSEFCITRSDEVLLVNEWNGTFSFCRGDMSLGDCLLAGGEGSFVGDPDRVLDDGSLAGGGDPGPRDSPLVGRGDRLEVYPR